MIAEDEALMLKTISIKLRKDGYDVITCQDGQEAIAKINELHPDLVIADIMLPYASGFEIVNAVKAIAEKKIYVIMLSALGQEKTVAEAFSLGADDYMTKPFSLSELSIRVKKLIR
ncbi:response regulator transcription factor [Panacibacter microcysteis]|nr:response regulator [Panacibacter microcysteis]